jgi:broad specificity phosphatase PhoE
LEGQEITPDKVDFMNSLVTQHPDFKPQGRGPVSVADGESFNDFKNRVIPVFDRLLRDHIANPQERTAVVTHFRNRKLAEAMR